MIPSHLYGDQAKIKVKVLCCYSHKVKHVYFQSEKFIPECTKYFKTIEAIFLLFLSFSVLQEKRRKKVQFLDEVVKKRLLRATSNRWSVNSKFLQTNLHRHPDLCKPFNVMKKAAATWDVDAR